MVVSQKTLLSPRFPWKQCKPYLKLFPERTVSSLHEPSHSAACLSLQVVAVRIPSKWYYCRTLATSLQSYIPATFWLFISLSYVSCVQTDILLYVGYYLSSLLSLESMKSMNWKRTSERRSLPSVFETAERSGDKQNGIAHRPGHGLR